MRHLLTFISVLAVSFVSAQPYNHSDYYLVNSSDYSITFKVGDAILDGITDLYVYVVNDGSNAAQHLRIPSQSEEIDGVLINSTGVMSTDYAWDYNASNKYVVYKRSALSYNNTYIANFATWSTYDGNYGNLLEMEVIPDAILMSTTSGSYYQWGEVIQTYSCLVCSEAYIAGLNRNWYCDATQTAKTLKVHYVLINPEEKNRTTYNGCVNGSDPTLFSGNLAYGFQFSNITTGKGDYYSETSNALDVSAHGAGSITLIQNWTFPTSYFPLRSSNYTYSYSYNPGTIYAQTDLEFDDAEVCYGSSLSLSSLVNVSGGTFSGTGVTSAGLFNASGTLAAGDYTITYNYTNSNSCSSSTSATITVNASPTLTAINDGPICIGETVRLTGSGASSYEWFANGVSMGTGSKLDVTPTTTTTYTLNGTNSKGCTASKTTTVTVNSLPVVVANADQTICYGESVTLSATGANSYSWTPTSGLNNANIASPVASPSSTMTYQVVGSNSAGCTNYDEALITVNPLPDVLITPSETEVCSGETVTLVASGGSTYKWYVGNTTGSVVNTSNTYSPKVTADTRYYVVGTYNGCSQSTFIDIKVSGTSANAGSNKTICKGSSVQLSASGGVSYSWSPATGLSDTNVSNPIASPATSTTYTVTTLNADGCPSTDEVVVTVLSIPVVTATSDQTICKGSSVQLSASGASGYIWSPATSLNVNNLGTVIASPLVTTVYTVTGNNSNGCSDDAQVVVYVNENPTADAGSDKEVCFDSDLVLEGAADGTVGPYSYSWSGEGIIEGGNTASPTVNITEDASYTLTVTDAKGCSDSDKVEVEVNELPVIYISVDDFVTEEADICKGSLIQLEASGGVRYSWSGSAYLSHTGISNPTVTVNADMTLTVVVEDHNGCIHSASIEIHAVENPNVDAGGILNICEDDGPYDLREDVSIQGGFWEGDGIINDFMFDPTSLEPGIYILTYTIDLLGCSGYDTREVRIKEKPKLTVSEEQLLCPGESVQLLAAGATSYEWYPKTNITNAYIANPVVSPGQTTTYTVTGKDVYGCTNSEKVLITVNELAVNAGTNASICQGESVVLEASSNNSNVTYQWIPATGLNDDSVLQPTAFPLETTTYSLLCTDNSGCTRTDQVTVTVQDKPDLKVGEKLILCQSSWEGYDLRQDVNISGGVFQSSSSGLDGVLYYANEEDPGIYFVEYTVQVGNCELTASREIVVIKSEAINIDKNEFEICPTESIQIDITGGVSYAYYPEKGVSDVTIGNPTISPSESTDYQVIVYDVNGCSTTIDLSVEVKEMNVFAGTDETICSGESTQLSGSGGAYYSWSPANSLSNAKIEDPIASPGVTTTYQLMVLDKEGCTGYDEVIVYVNEAPDLDVGAPIYLCLDGERYDLRQDVNIAGGVFTSEDDGLVGVEFDPTEVDAAGIYFVEYTVTVNGCTVTATKEIHVVGYPAIKTEKSSYTTCTGESVQLSVTSPSGYMYSWYPATGLDDPTSSSPVATLSTSTTYEVTVTNSTGCSNSLSIPVMVNKPSIAAGSDVTICSGESVQLSASGGEYYSWSPSVGLSNTTIKDPIAAPASTMEYTVSGIDENGCTAEDRVVVMVNQPIEHFEIGEKLVLCHSDNTSYDLRQDVNIAGGVFSSDGEGLNGVFFEPDEVDPGVYFVEYTITESNCSYSKSREIEVRGDPAIWVDQEEFEICLGESVTPAFEYDGKMTFDWSHLSGSDNPETVVLSPTIDKQYSVKVTDEYGCWTTITFDIDVNSIAATAGSDKFVCAGESTTLKASGGNVYIWDSNSDLSTYYDSDPEVTPSRSQYYYVQIWDNNGCSIRDSVYVSVRELPELIFSQSSIIVCNGSEITNLNDYINLVGAEWEGKGATSSGLFDPEESGVGSFPISIHYEDKNGCTITGELLVKVQSLPSVDAGPKRSICLESEALDLSTLAVPTGGTFFGTGMIDDHTFLADNAGPGEHTLTYTYTDLYTGCSNSDTRIIEVLEPESVFAGSPLSICIDAGPVDLSQSVSPSGGVFSSDIGINGNYFYPSTGVGTYVITYTVWDNDNCPSSSTRIITVNNRPELNISPEVLYVCENTGVINLSQYVDISGGTWSGSKYITNSLLNTDSLPTGNTILIYEVSTAKGCTLSENLIVNVQAIDSLELGEAITTCQAGNAIDLLNGYDPERVSVSGEGLIAGIFNPASVTVGTHTVSYTYSNQNGCETTQTLDVYVSGSVYVDVANDFTVCKSVGEISLSEKGMPTDGTWTGQGVTLNTFDASGLDPGVYTLTYTRDLGSGCSNSATLDIEVISNELKDFGNDTLICINSGGLDLITEALEGGSWSNSNGETGVINNVFYPSQSGVGTFTVNYSNADWECGIAGNRNITVVDLPEKAITDNYSISGCMGDVVRITATVDNPSNGVQINYEWYYEGEDEPFYTGKTLDLQIRASENIYFNTINQFGCRSNEQEYIRITANGPSGNFESDKDTLVIGELIQFTVHTTNVDVYYWEFGDGNYSTDKNPNYRYWVKGSYEVSLTMTSPDECENSITNTNSIYVYDPDDTLSAVLGIKEGEREYKMYPNPVSDVLTVEVLSGKSGTLVIYDITGKELQTLGLTLGINRMPIRDLIAALYFVKIDIHENTYIEKLIKKP